MATHFQPLPLELFTAEQRPYIARLNHQLRELFALEGTIRQPIQSKRSDNSISRRAEVQVDVSRITPDMTQVISGSSTVTGVPALTLGLVNAVGTTTTAIAVDSSVALFGTATPSGISTAGAVGSSAFAARADHVHSYSATFGTNTPTGVSLTGAVGTSDYISRADHRHAHQVFTGGDLHEDLLPRSGIRGMTGRLTISTTEGDGIGSAVPTGATNSAFVLVDTVARAAGEYYVTLLDSSNRAKVRVVADPSNLNDAVFVVNRDSASTSSTLRASQWQFNNTGLDGSGTAHMQVGSGAGNRILFSSPNADRGFRFTAGSSGGSGIRMDVDDANVANDNNFQFFKQRGDTGTANDFAIWDHSQAWGGSRRFMRMRANSINLAFINQAGRYFACGASVSGYSVSGRNYQVNGLAGGRFGFLDVSATEPTT